MKAQKPVHTTRGQEWAIERTDGPKAMANAWAADKLWTYTEVEHVQGSSTTNLYPANTGVMGYGSKVKEGVV